MRAANERIEIVDLLRGLALVLLVLEAARQYFHGALYSFDPLNPDRTTPAIYLTRWATHLAAPILAVLAGASACLRLASGGSRMDVSRFLLLRGLLIIALELTVVTFARNFTLPPPILFAALGTIGCAMIALAAMIWLPRQVVFAAGVAILLITDLLNQLHAWHFGPLGPIWQLLHEPLAIIENGRLIAIADYSFIPWTAMVMIGFGLGPRFMEAPARRDRILIGAGAALILLFLLLRAANSYGDANPWLPRPDAARTLMAFFNVSKFPPSLQYASITIGIALLLAPLLTRAHLHLRRLLSAFGAAPLFTYVMHVYLLHAMAWLALTALGRDPSPMIDAISKFRLTPQAYAGSGFDLPVVFLAWLAGLAFLYPLSRWWADLKRRRMSAWLSYF